MQSIRNPKLYRQMCEPAESSAAVNAAVQAFNDELRALRERHRIADVHVIMSGNFITDAGDEATYILTAHHGDPSKAEAMAAHAQATAAAERQAAIGGMFDRAIKRAKGS